LSHTCGGNSNRNFAWRFSSIASASLRRGATSVLVGQQAHPMAEFLRDLPGCPPEWLFLTTERQKRASTA